MVAAVESRGPGLLPRRFFFLFLRFWELLSEAPLSEEPDGRWRRQEACVSPIPRESPITTQCSILPLHEALFTSAGGCGLKRNETSPPETYPWRRADLTRHRET